VEDIDFCVDFVVGNSKQFGRKNQLSLQYVHTWANGTGYTSMYAIGIV